MTVGETPLDPELRRTMEKQWKVLSLTWRSSVAALFLYLLLPLIVGLSRSPVSHPPYRGFRMVLWLVALVEAAALFWWSRRFLTKEGALRGIRGTAVNPLTYYVGRKIGALGIAQSIAVYGLVLALVGGYFWDQYILTFLSAALLVWHYPSRGMLEELSGAAGAERQT